MVYVPNKDSNWTHRNLFVLSRAGGLLNHLKEMTRKYHWRVVDQVETVKDLFKAGEKEPISAILIDDVADRCSLEIALELRCNINTMLKPLIVFMPESWRADLNLIKRALNVSVMFRPLTIAKFGQTFDETIKLWDSPVFAGIRKIDGMPFPAQYDSIHKIFERLKTVPAAIGICAVAQARYLELKGQAKDAEKVLLDGLKATPKDSHLLFGTARFYIRNGMPKIALRLLETLRASYGDTTLFDLDASFAAVQLGQLNKAVDSLVHFRQRGDESSTINSSLQKMLIAEGRVLELENQYSDKKQAMQKAIADWDKLEALSA